MAKQVDERRRAAAATLMWILMIAGFAVTSATVGHFLDPFSPQRLLRVIDIAAGAAFLAACAAVWGVESPGEAAAIAAARAAPSFAAALRRVWCDRQARRFTLFVFVSMLAYSAQELLIEPFCGLVFGYSVGDSARLSGLWHGCALIGMIAVGLACSGRRRFGSLRLWTTGGCYASALALAGLCAAGPIGAGWPLRPSVAALGIANGVFAVSAIGSMMALAHRGETGAAGMRMGLWGAAQAIAFALGGLLGTAVIDSARWLAGSPVTAFAIVFGVEALLFLAAGRLAAGACDLNHARGSAHPATAVIA